jgi:hypothetical protein
MDTNAFTDPVVQHGFAGLAAILLALLAWLVRRLLELFAQTTAVIEKNTAAITGLEDRTGELARVAGEMRDRLLVRPCLAAE